VKENVMTKAKKMTAKQSRLLDAIRDDYERAVARGEPAYADALKESLRRVESGQKP
jgi:hypothetical protein